VEIASTGYSLGPTRVRLVIRSMDLPETMKSLLQQYGISPRRLGQNFLVEPSVFELMADYASLASNDVVLDVGGGLGFLTRFLAKRCRHVLTVEMDCRVAEALRNQLRDHKNVEVIEGNVLEVRIPYFNKAVSVPPYYISSRLIMWLFGRHFERGALVLQKEFARLLVAAVGSQDYGWLTVLTYYHSEVGLHDRVPRQWFYPSPNVDSIIVSFSAKEESPFELRDESKFAPLVKNLFRQRNRKVRNAALPYIKAGSFGACADEAADFAGSLPFCDRRVRELAPEDFGVLANALIK